jgi:uncharacterized protein (TIGR02300 family)
LGNPQRKPPCAGGSAQFHLNWWVANGQKTAHITFYDKSLSKALTPWIAYGRWHRSAASAQNKGIVMPKEEWGTKRVCPTTGKRFYDLNKNPIVSPYTGDVVAVDDAKTRTIVADAEDAQTKKLKDSSDDEDMILDDDDVDLGDDVLEEDDDEDNVSFEELGDVAADSDDD